MRIFRAVRSWLKDSQELHGDGLLPVIAFPNERSGKNGDAPKG